MSMLTMHSSCQLEATNYDIAQIAARLEAIVGAENMLVQEHELELASRTNIPERRVPDLVVFPIDPAQVEQIVKLSNEFCMPVWPVSQGKNWGYGSKSACYSGGITMILARMNRIHEVNEELGYAVIEPGVTYAQLNDYLKLNHPTLWVDSAGSTKDASVIGNALDRGRGLTPYADHFGCLCGMEVVLPDGKRIQTGGGPVGGYPTWNVYKWGTGPYLDGLFSQSSLGIVVKSGIWLMPAPEKFDFFVFEYTAGQSRFSSFLDDFRKLLFQGVIKSRPHLANDFAMLCIVDQYPTDLLDPGRRHLTLKSLEMWKKRLGVTDWTFGCGMYGNKAEVRLHKRIVRRTLGKYGELTFAGGLDGDSVTARIMLRAARAVMRLKGKSPKFVEALPDAIRLFKGIPTDYFARQVYFKSHAEKPSLEDDLDPTRDGCGFVWIGPVVPFTGGHLISFMNEVKPLYEKFQFDYFVELIVESPRSVIMLFGLFYDKTDEEETRRAQQLYEAIRDLAYKRGYPPYRASVSSTTRVFDCNPPLKAVVNQIKKTLDPNNVLAPGRYGAGV